MDVPSMVSVAEQDEDPAAVVAVHVYWPASFFCTGEMVSVWTPFLEDILQRLVDLHGLPSLVLKARTETWLCDTEKYHYYNLVVSSPHSSMLYTTSLHVTKTGCYISWYIVTVALITGTMYPFRQCYYNVTMVTTYILVHILASTTCM